MCECVSVWRLLLIFVVPAAAAEYEGEGDIVTLEIGIGILGR